MTIRTYIRSILLGALIALSLAGYMIHARIHFIAQNPSFLVPFVAGILSITVIPVLFWFKKTLAYGYVLNGFLCIIGTITMAHFAIAHWSAPTSPPDILLKSMVIDILIVWGKFFIGKALFESGDLRVRPEQAESGHYLPVSEYGMVADPLGRRQSCLLPWQPFVELAMDQFKWFTRNWWILHTAAVTFFFWLGHAIHF